MHREHLGHGLDQIGRVTGSSGLIAGMHGQLRQSHIHGGNAHLGRGDVAQGRATGKICPVAEGLGGNPRLFAGLAKECGGNTVGGVALVGVKLDDNAAS